MVMAVINSPIRVAPLMTLSSVTAKRIISGDVLKYRNGFFIKKCYETRVAALSQFPQITPMKRHFSPILGNAT